MSTSKCRGKNRYAQCNLFFPDPDALVSHVNQVHTYPVIPGTLAYRKAFAMVQQKYQDGLPKVRLRSGEELRNEFMIKLLDMKLDATGNDEDHVRQTEYPRSDHSV